MRNFFLVSMCLLITLAAPAGLAQFYFEPMDSNPGWTISGGEWEFGTPTGLNSDPGAAYTGTYVYGYDLTSNQRYENSIPEYNLTTGAISCTGRSNVHLSFARWLGVENNSWDHAYVRISNDGGTVWNDVWANGTTTINETAWTVVDYDISAWADGQADVRIRWTMGTTDGSVVYQGWNIDDVQLFEYDPVTLTMNTPIGPGTVIPDVGPHIYNRNQVVNISAAASTCGYTFVEWLRDGSFYSNDAMTTITMDTDRTLQARFDLALPDDLLFCQGGDEPQNSATSVIDTAQGVDYEVAENFWGVAGTIETVATYGLSLVYSGGWSDCPPTASEPFIIRFYTGLGQDDPYPPAWSMPVSEQSVVPTITAVGPIWGLYTLYRYEFALPMSVNVYNGWVSIQADVDSGATCWFLQGDTTVGDLQAYQRGAVPELLGYDMNIELWGTAGSVPTMYTLTMQTPVGSGSTIPVPGAYSYAQNSVVPVSAIPGFGWEFDSWTGSVANPNDDLTTITMTGNQVVQANFIPGSSLLMYEDFAVNPGWTMDGSWQWGAATASVGCNGSQDPDDDTTGEGNILGYAIGACYANSIAATEWATSPVIDFSGYVDIQMGFDRLLGVESATYDHASIEVYDGSVWQQVWNHTGTSLSDSNWTTIMYDISAYADDNANFQIRFGMGATDGSVVYCGWNIDGLGFTGETPGYISGVVTSDGGTNPVIGATVELAGTGRTAITQAPAGAYSFTVAPGTYDMEVTAAGYNTAGATGVMVLVGMTTTQNFDLTYPEIGVNPMAHTVTLSQPETDTRTVTISNTGTGPLDFSIGFANFTESKAMWDVLADVNTGLATALVGNLGAEFDGQYLWITSGNTTPNQIFRMDPDGLNPVSYPQGTTSVWGMRDMTSDGTYLYAGDDNGFYRINPSDGSVTTLFSTPLPGGLVCIRGLSYKPDTGTFIASNWSDPLVEFQSDGTLVTTYTTGAQSSTYGIEYDDYSAGGPFVWLFNQAGSPLTTFVQLDASTMLPTGVTYQLPLQTGLADQMAGGCFVSTTLVPGKIVLGAMLQGDPDDHMVALELGDYATWVSAAPLTGTVSNGSSTDVIVTFDSNEVAGVGTYTCDMRIASNDGDENPTIVDLTMIVVPPNPDDPVCGADPAPICAGQSVDVTATASGTDVVRWFDNPGDPVPQTPLYEGGTYNVSPTTTSTYYAWAFDGSNYSLNYCDVTITVNPLPDCTISAPASIVENTTGTISVADAGVGAVYNWVVSGNGTIISTTPYGNSIQIQAGALAGGDITVNLSITDSNGCSCTAAPATITVVGVPPVPATGPAGLALLLLALGGLLAFTRRK